ncbi:unnamed protein product [Rotaria sp. Silwood1]|nr:unnamed protein product [Rotaria sp. Silwood1]CAF1659325.1 unnamed protein product [Rotaria sp. Silwood1]CAF3537773.1 unnamed protein product [Rotaria sp. Silwood1]CAF3853561.1 unnamed protein product [Rotaria sp. Silwood1]CAF4946733.1 unnamed protein product [Rotaria sp. Silwood1]
MIEEAFEIRSTRTVATATELEDTIATSSNTNDLENEKASSQFENLPSCIICDLDHDDIVSNLLHRTESSDTDDWETDTESLCSDPASTLDVSSSAKTKFSLPDLKIFIDQLKVSLANTKHEISEMVFETPQEEHSERYWAWRLERAIKSVQSEIEMNECK